jgi:hypothetical protein
MAYEKVDMWMADVVGGELQGEAKMEAYMYYMAFETFKDDDELNHLLTVMLYPNTYLDKTVWDVYHDLHSAAGM